MWKTSAACDTSDTDLKLEQTAFAVVIPRFAANSRIIRIYNKIQQLSVR
jgi:hypothetical protein